jgi:hypothetical protein
MFVMRQIEGIPNDLDEFEIFELPEGCQNISMAINTMKVRYDAKFSCFVARKSFKEINVFEVDRESGSDKSPMEGYISMRRCTEINSDSKENRYYQCVVYKNFKYSKTERRTEYVHKLICYCWGDKNGISKGATNAAGLIGLKPEDITIDHINCKKYDNRPENLEYISAEENWKRILARAISGGEGQRKEPLREFLSDKNDSFRDAFWKDIIGRAIGETQSGK